MPTQVGIDDYPMIDCDLHRRQRSYLMCKHTIDGTPAKHIEAATDEMMGVAVCQDCADEYFKTEGGRDLDKFVLICKQHSREFCGEIP